MRPASSPAAGRATGTPRQVDSAGLLDHARAPYAEALHQHAETISARVGVPGHAADADRGVAAYFGRIIDLDIPPLTDGIDRAPQGQTAPLDAARALAADAWGARRTWFLTNGASQGNLTVCQALRQHTDEVVVVRSMHSSVTDGLALAGVTPHTVMPHLDALRGMAHGITPADLDASLRRNPGAGAAWVVSPSYFGAVSDIAGLAKVAHSHGVPLIVDEAWGAHFGFHPDLPTNALRLGADIVVSSTHKLGGSLGQSAMLHLGHGEFADDWAPSIDRAIRMMSSTSESSLLLAGLDLARRDLVTRTDAIGRSIDDLEVVRETLRGDDRFAIATDDLLDDDAVFAVDPLRLVVDTRGTGLTGHEVRHRMFHEHGVQLEMSTDAVVVALIGAGTRVDIATLLAAFEAMPIGTASDVPVHSLPEVPPRRVGLRQATFAPSEVVAAHDAIGRISADSLAAYPPGIPQVLPGELITAETVEFLQAVARSPHGYVRGADHPLVEHLRVLTDD